MRMHTEHANALIDDFISENPRFTEVSSTGHPVILGECFSNSSCGNPSIQFLRGVGLPPSMYVSIRIHMVRG